ncbi:hypothetical protein RhiXN_07902 [Rhizoctonia solani]|uniref:Uncharacterized protein n=1 Tax=Rhizoctonia solani TaxID=456999 RepID=A0A8H8P2R1_9AGAM|nr:uncharacterized protein RhiXN_07902 [Rhizoctonia solani]QRW22866.1 hypothetical protein RhiXN_07902 [Rhizoctonia solani]
MTMPYLSIIVTSFIALSTKISPVLSLSAGKYTISVRPNGLNPSLLYSEYGVNEEIQVGPFEDRQTQQALWSVIPDPQNENNVRFENVQFHCAPYVGSRSTNSFSSIPTIICGDLHSVSEEFKLTQISNKAGTYYIDTIAREPPRRMFVECYNELVNGSCTSNVTLTLSGSPLPELDLFPFTTEFTFTPVP